MLTKIRFKTATAQSRLAASQGAATQGGPLGTAPPLGTPADGGGGAARSPLAGGGSSPLMSSAGAGANIYDQQVRMLYLATLPEMHLAAHFPDTHTHTQAL